MHIMSVAYFFYISWISFQYHTQNSVLIGNILVLMGEGEVIINTSLIN